MEQYRRRRQTEDEITEMRDEVSGESYEREPYTLTADEARYIEANETTTINMLGVVLAILGVVMLLATVTSTIISIVLLGALLAIAAVMQLIASFRSRSTSTTMLGVLLAIVYAGMAWFFLGRPVLGAISFTIVLAILLAIVGVIRAVSSVMERRENWGWPLFVGLVELALGVMLWNGWPVSGLYGLGLVLGIELLASGIVLISAADTNELVA